MSIVLLVLGLVLFVSLVIVHELGHFLAARRNGVEVEEFGIGFPPRAWERKTKRGFLLTLNWLPIGGFVKLKGENDSATAKGSFGAARFSVKAKIMLAGVAMNLAAAFVIFTALGWLGMPQLVDHQFAVKSDTHTIRQQVLIGFVEPKSPAQKAGLQARDHVVGLGLASHSQSLTDSANTSAKPMLGEQTVTSSDRLVALTKQFTGQPVTVYFERGGSPHTATLTLRTAAQAKDQGYLGIVPSDYTLTRSTWSAPVQAAGLLWQFTALTFQGLGHLIVALFHGDGSAASQQVTGPVGIVAILRDGSLLGYQLVLMIVGLISLSLAIMNVLPIPALDGGRFYMLLLSRLFGKRLSKDMEERIVGASFVFLIGLIIIITIVDVKRFF